MTQDVVFGAAWSAQGSTLVSTATGGGIVRFPYTAPTEYDVKITLSRLAGNGPFGMGLTYGDKTFTVFLDGFNQGTGSHASGVGRVGGVEYHSNETAYQGRVFSDTKNHIIHILVRRNRVYVAVDNKKIIDWKADYSKIVYPPERGLGNVRGLYLLAFGGSYKVQRVVMTPIIGRGKPTR